MVTTRTAVNHPVSLDGCHEVSESLPFHVCARLKARADFLMAIPEL